jgi:putative methyltransferase (TIGR04325 family)
MWLQPRLERLARLLVGKAPPILFSKPKSSWDHAVVDSAGYEAVDLVDGCLEAAMAVQRGDAAYERDTVLFFEPELDLPLVAAVAMSRGACGRQVRVLDIGGGLGTGFFRHREILHQIGVSSWRVLETPAMVQASKELAEEPGLSFVTSLEEALHDPLDLVVFSSSLQYMSEPRKVLEAALSSTASVVLLDRLPMWSKPTAAPVVQTTPAGTIGGTYPCWLLAERELLRWVGPEWVLASGYDAIGGNWATDAGDLVKWRGLLLVRNGSLLDSGGTAEGVPAR